MLYKILFKHRKSVISVPCTISSLFFYLIKIRFNIQSGAQHRDDSLSQDSDRLIRIVISKGLFSIQFLSLQFLDTDLVYAHKRDY